MAYRHQPVLIPLHNQACRVDPGNTDVCPAGEGGVGDPHGNNTWYYVHTLAVFYIDEVLVQGNDVKPARIRRVNPLYRWPPVPASSAASKAGS